MVVRRHWLVWAIVGAYAFIILALTVFLLTLPSFTGLSFSSVIVATIVLWMYGIQFIFLKWIDYELDFFLITDKRIIGYEQIGFMNRKSTQASIDQIQEVFATTK